MMKTTSFAAFLSLALCNASSASGQTLEWTRQLGTSAYDGADGGVSAGLLLESKLSGRTYNLHGTPITQQQLADFLNVAFGTSLTYRSMTIEEYRAERITELGEFMGTVIAGIYEGIRIGAADNESHFCDAAGRPHESWDTYFGRLAERR